MKNNHIISVSLPSSIIEQIDQLSHIEDRSRSSIMRRALLDYIAAWTPEETPVLGDLDAIKNSKKEYDLSQGVTLKELRDEIQIIHSKKRGKTRK